MDDDSLKFPKSQLPSCLVSAAFVGGESFNDCLPDLVSHTTVGGNPSLVSVGRHGGSLPNV